MHPNPVLTDEHDRPSLSPSEFQLGDRTFTVVYLGYEQQLEFLSLLQPLLGVIMASSSGAINTLSGIGFSAADISAGALLRFSGDDLPRMVAMVCNQAAIDDDRPLDKVTAEWIKAQKVNPFTLAKIVLKQVAVNQVIPQIVEFLAELRPVMAEQHHVG